MRFLFVTLARGVMGTLMLAGVAICFANVLARYLFGYALFWAEEVMVFLVIFACLVYYTKKKVWATIPGEA